MMKLSRPNVEGVPFRLVQIRAEPRRPPSPGAPGGPGAGNNGRPPSPGAPGGPGAS